MVMHLRHRHLQRRQRQHGLVVAERPTVRDRVAVHWRAAQLDHELADGIPAEDSPALALRARRLTGIGRRRSMADALRRIVREVDGPATTHPVQVVPIRDRVSAAADELVGLADALAEPGPVAARGAAEARMLLTDGTGPLFNVCSRVSLKARARLATEHLRASEI